MFGMRRLAAESRSEKLKVDSPEAYRVRKKKKAFNKLYWKRLSNVMFYSYLIKGNQIISTVKIRIENVSEKKKC